MRNTNDLHIVGFRIGAETFGVPIARVKEIVRVPAITAIPEAPACVEGVINLRGKIIPVVDLRKRFGEEAAAPGKKSRILVAEAESKLVGLLVDSASEVLNIPRSAVEDPPDVFDEHDLRYVTGVGKLDSRLIILLDLTKVLEKGDLKRLGEITAQTQSAETTVQVS